METETNGEWSIMQIGNTKYSAINWEDKTND